MQYTTHNSDDSIPMKTNGSSFKGRIQATFTQLVALFGKPEYIDWHIGMAKHEGIE